MRLGVRGREALVVSRLTLLVVPTATAIHLSQVSRVVVQEAVKQAELIAKQIYAQSGRALQRASGADPLEGLLKLATLSRFPALYNAGRTYETTLPVTLNDRFFGSIRLGVSTTLLRREV